MFNLELATLYFTSSFWERLAVPTAPTIPTLIPDADPYGMADPRQILTWNLLWVGLPSSSLCQEWETFKKLGTSRNHEHCEELPASSTGTSGCLERPPLLSFPDLQSSQDCQT